jgi:uncharacterized protein YkwD
MYRLSLIRKIFIQAILIGCLYLTSTSVLAESSRPGGLPVLPDMAITSLKTGSRIPSQDLAEPGTNFIYLPLIQQGQVGLTVNLHNRQESIEFYVQQYLTSEGVAMNWTGDHASCDPGTAGEDFRLAVLRRINYFRAMAGVPAEIKFSDESNRKAQAAALMMSVNRQLSHSPPTSWICSSSTGAEGAGSSNLFLGAYSWDAIMGYMRDPGSGNSAVGHRRWILYPQTQVMGTGDIPNTQNYPASNALRVFDEHMWEQRPSTREEYVAWPPPGYVPYQVVFPKWSFSYANADFSGSSVTMESSGSNFLVNQANVVSGYGENTLVWIPMGLDESSSWPIPAADTTYTVSIHNVLINNQSREFTYSVIVFNPDP